MIPIEEALKLISESVMPLATDTVELSKAVGRVLAEPVYADVDSPPHRKSVMDGYAVRAVDLQPECRLKVLETIIAGAVPTVELTAGTCSRVMTGAPVPIGSDAVVMVEQAEQDGEFVTFSIDSVDAGKHTLDRAASFAKGEEMFTAGHTIRAIDIGLLAEVGASQLTVKKQITASVLPTGNELVDVATAPGPGQIRNSNGPMLEAMLEAAGVAVENSDVARDDREELENKVRAGLNCDLLILSGGVSAGTMDLVPETLQKCGVEQKFHKVCVKPGKPIWFGVLQRDAQRSYAFGLPGNPVSSLVGFQLFVTAAIAELNGLGGESPPLFRGKLVQQHTARGNRPTYWPGCWSEAADGERVVNALNWNGSSDLRALGLANCLILFPTGRSYAAGEIVQVLPVN